jgi:hypothetical protein
MIAYDSIKTKKGLYPDGSWDVIADLKLQSVQPITKNEFDTVPRILELAIDDVHQKLWDSIYGELSEPIKALQHYAIRNALPGDEKTVSDLCDKINKLLRLP